jgi:hypothetical protein
MVGVIVGDSPGRVECHVFLTCPAPRTNNSAFVYRSSVRRKNIEKETEVIFQRNTG